MPLSSSSKHKDNSSNAVATFCQYIPLRLSAPERALLRVLESTLHVSEYTDHVDVAMRRPLKVKRILDNILEAAHIGTGLAVAGRVNLKECLLDNNNSNGGDDSEQQQQPDGGEGGTTTTTKKITKKLKKKKKALAVGRKKKTKRFSAAATVSFDNNIAAREPADNALLFQTMFEVGRRNKVLNPSSMRDTYGKLMYLLQDAQAPTVAKSLGFSLHKDLVLVGPYLEDADCAALLTDSRLQEAVRVVSEKTADGTPLPRDQVATMVRQQRELRTKLQLEYAASSKLTSDQIENVLESIRDAFAYVDANVRPVQTTLDFLEDNFDPHSPSGGKEFSLELRGSSRSPMTQPRYGFSAFSTSGSSGPTLSHSHSTQYTFVWQSLQLWCKIQRNMHKLWVCADDDLLSTSTSYHLHNTGQGLQRVQQCPRVAKVMRQLLSQTQTEAGAAWVGLSVIHLGDRDVPNALVFIDKYTQIPRFLNPICTFLKGLDDEAMEDAVFQQYILSNFGSIEKLKIMVLQDYFKHGFDGSGDDGGSCIDGRLTSSWNWTSLIAKKKYYHAFMLSGFQGFDGDFK